MMRMRFLIAAIFFCFSANLCADVVRYTYTGAAFDTFDPGLPAGLTGISGYIEVDGGLDAGTSGEIVYSPLIVGLHFTDGVTEIGFNNFSTYFSYTTDALGDISAWYFAAQCLGYNSRGCGNFQRLTIRSSDLDGFDKSTYFPEPEPDPPTGIFIPCGSLVCPSNDPQATTTAAPGNWTSQVVPVPAAAWLFGSGLGLLGWMRKFK